MYVDHFGYLPIKETFSFPVGRVEPEPQFDAATEWMHTYAAEDGFVYPPHQPKAVKVGEGFLTIPVEESGSPATSFRLPASHVLYLQDFHGSQDDARYGLAAFVMHFFGFLLGHRCHFHDWWVDGRVSVKSTADHRSGRHVENERALQYAIKAWTKWSTEVQTIALNVAFLHARAPQYRRDWERFQAEYMVLDAVAGIAIAVGLISPQNRHSDRITAMCDAFSLAHDADRINRIVHLRNTLIHETLWDGRMPGEHRSEESWRAPYWIHNITKRAFLAVCGINGD